MMHFSYYTPSISDVDTDLYKLIMSPQYLTTEHIQVSVRFDFYYDDIPMYIERSNLVDKTFLYQILLALKYMHSSCVIHRDLVSEDTR